MPVTWDDALKEVEKSMGNYKHPEPVTGMPPDVALNPLVTGKSLLSLVKKVKRGFDQLPKNPNQMKLATSKLNPSVQSIWNPTTKKIENIPTEKAQEILKEKGFSNLPMLNMDEKKVFDFGIMTPKTYNIGKKEISENLQYGYIHALMTDRDFENILHPSSSINAKHLGDIYDGLLRFHKNNPLSVITGGLTPGGGRAFEVSNYGAQNLTGERSMEHKLNWLKGTKADPNYLWKELERSGEGYIDYATDWGLLKNAVHRVQMQKPLKNFDRDNPNKSVEEFLKIRDRIFPNNPWKLKPQERSAIRMDIKPDRLNYMAGNDKYGAPFGYEELFTIGNPNNISAKQLDIVRRAGDATKDLRTMRGAVDPDRPEFGAGFLKELEKQLPTLPNKVQADIRAKLLLGLTPFIMPTSKEQTD